MRRVIAPNLSSAPSRDRQDDLGGPQESVKDNVRFTPLLDQAGCRLDGFLMRRGLDLLLRKIPMDAIFILLTLALFASSLAFVRLCERV